MPGRIVGEKLEMKAPQALHVFPVPFNIAPHDWQIWISNLETPKRLGAYFDDTSIIDGIADKLRD
ncbi:MAG: hypothetical protein U0103_25680 [Candidatus Obscuribacterales bacterium]|nr:hypothetical protein [Cyanobacteria bacterium SZAS LIN-5]RTL34540.1 MAG: hypothetical protein EKK48_31220 [Candidatus Melainabacteria bacterium]